MKRNKVLFVFLLFVFLNVLYPGHVFSEKSPENETESRIRVLLVPEIDTVLSSQITGKIIELNTAMGRMFEKDEILVKFDCEDQYARLKIYEAEQKAAEITYNSKTELKELSSSSATEVKLAEASLDKAKAQILLQKNMIENCVIKAPFKGGCVKQWQRSFR